MSPFRAAARLEVHRCPRDGSRLERREIAVILVHACATCSGVWLGEAALLRLQGDPELRELVADDPCAHRPRPARLPDAARAVRCCVCGAACQRGAYAPGAFIEVDTCAEHGMWLDAGGLFVLLYHEGLRTRR